MWWKAFVAAYFLLGAISFIMRFLELREHKRLALMRTQYRAKLKLLAEIKLIEEELE